MSSVTQAVEYPRLRHCTFVISDEKIYMVFGQDYFEVTGIVGDHKQFMALKRYMDGRHTLKEISENTGIAEEYVKDIVIQLEELALFRKEERMERIDTSVFLQSIQDIAVMWSRQIGYHRLYAGLERKEFPESVFIGLMIETYHYVASAPKHIATAIAHCNDKRLEHILVDYFLDEHDHAHLILNTLEKLGVPQEGNCLLR